MKPLITDRNISILIASLSISLMFFLPISTTIKSILLIACVLTILCTPKHHQYLYQAFNSLWGRTACVLFVFVLIATFWSPAPFNMQLSVIEKYAKLIYLPILAVAFINPRSRVWGLRSFLMAVSLITVISILKSRGLLTSGDALDDQGAIFNNHIVTGFIIAFGSYLSCYFFVQHQGWLRLFYFILFLLTSYQVLFINTGRTGYLIYVVLMILFIVQQFPLTKALMAIALFSAIIGFSYTQSSMMQYKINTVWAQLALLKENKKDHSIGYRVQFHDYARQLFTEHPIKGQGIGSFKYRFSQDLPIPSWGNVLNEPHSQYWMTLAEMGLIGFVFLLMFLGSLLLYAFKIKENRPILLGFLLAFSIVCFLDTIFCYSVLGYMLILISALSFGELLEKTVPLK